MIFGLAPDELRVVVEDGGFRGSGGGVFGGGGVVALVELVLGDGDESGGTD
jgi:hypothetical protein